MTPAELLLIRKHLKLTRLAMSQKLGITESQLYKLETGRSAISRPVEMLAEQLFGNSERLPPS